MKKQSFNFAQNLATINNIDTSSADRRKTGVNRIKQIPQALRL